MSSVNLSDFSRTVLIENFGEIAKHYPQLSGICAWVVTELRKDDLAARRELEAMRQERDEWKRLAEATKDALELMVEQYLRLESAGKWAGVYNHDFMTAGEAAEEALEMWPDWEGTGCGPRRRDLAAIDAAQQGEKGEG